MEAIARAAGVATPTVYALFGSKRNILAELIARTAFGPAYQDLVGETMALADPVAGRRMAPRISRQIYFMRRRWLGTAMNEPFTTPRRVRYTRRWPIAHVWKS